MSKKIKVEKYSFFLYNHDSPKVTWLGSKYTQQKSILYNLADWLNDHV